MACFNNPDSVFVHTVGMAGRSHVSTKGLKERCRKNGGETRPKKSKAMQTSKISFLDNNMLLS